MTLFGKALVSIIVLGLAGGGYFMYQNKSSVDSMENATKPVQGIAVGEPNPSAPQGKKMAFSQLMAQNGTYKCTVNQYVGDIESKGTVYMSGGLLRAEFATTVQGRAIDTTMITRDGYTYTWTSMAPTMGFKAKVVAPTTEGNTNVNANTKTSGSYSWNAEQIGDYNCEAWTVDQSKFTVPSSITFTSVN